MPPDAEPRTMPRASDAIPEDELSHPGCNCGRRRALTAPTRLLTDDLVIAARDRAREPELPANTEARALATPVMPQLARYDIIIVDDGTFPAGAASRLAAEFARHDHRVYHMANHLAGLRSPTAPTLTRLALPRTNALLPDLQSLRRDRDVETAILVVSPGFDATVATQVKDRWGWRVATVANSPTPLLDAADVHIAFDAESDVDRRSKQVPLPAAMSWPARWAALDRAFRSAWPRASLVVVTIDNLAFSRMCIASILENTEYPNFELLIVDNGSTDGSVEEFQRLERDVPNVRAFLNGRNLGLAPALNLGFREASGDILAILNNDIIVPRGWLTRLARHLADPAIGLIGPATNRTCNEAQLDFPYQTYAEYNAIARAQRARHEGERIPIRMPMMFCTAFRRDAYDRIGPLDEQYEVGMFEDEDYALRAKAAGYQTVWTPEVYIHHAYHASIGKLLPTGEYMRLVKLNQGRFEEKWGICWERHRPAPTSAQ